MYKKTFKNIIEILSNPLLYYTDKSGQAIFRNFCSLNNTGCIYNTVFPKMNVGKALEFRFMLDRRFKWISFLTPVILYFIFIHVNFSLLKLLFFEFLWLGIVFGSRIYFSKLYSEYLINHFGHYELCQFNPPIPQHKIDEFVAFYKSKIAIICILLFMYFIPAVCLQYTIKSFLSPKHLHSKTALVLSNIYTTFYPKSEHIYDMRAFSKFMERDYHGSLEDYKEVIVLSGHQFKQKDCTRFANLLLLQKKIGTTREAIELFDKYLSKKRMTVLNKSKMLWVKSIFKLENNITDNIIQEYEDLIASLDENDIKNQFYISSDLAYILYLMQDYDLAISNYNSLISFALDNADLFSKELSIIYIERGWAKKRIGDETGANQDFTNSGIPYGNLAKYEPSYENQKFVVEHF